LAGERQLSAAKPISEGEGEGITTLAAATSKRPPLPVSLVFILDPKP